MGGAVEAVERGYVQREIQEAAYAYQKAVESGERVVVGVNKFVTDEEFTGEILRVNPQVREEQKAALAQLRSQRDERAVEQNLAALKKAAQGEENLMPRFLDCVRSYVTLGEICGALRGVFGEYSAPTTI
jgi:methylmalonyl-CoA mutase N-terminal domain/subunit